MAFYIRELRTSVDFGVLGEVLEPISQGYQGRTILPVASPGFRNSGETVPTSRWALGPVIGVGKHQEILSTPGSCPSLEKQYLLNIPCTETLDS